ncbi:MAG TPA: helix-turn-helix transcriptional regulator [Ktedonobacterales bacterium]|nr:helix-turn-helix transcriptional regulator [Ktedonobacterales bacterium]
MVIKPTPNDLLRRQRELRGWSQAKVADLLHEMGGAADGKMVGKWERGVVRPSPYYRERLCGLFGLTAEQLGFVRSLPGEVATVVPLLSESGPQALFASGEALDMIRSRRQFLQELLQTACTALVLSPYAELSPESIERFVKAVAAPARVDTPVLEDLETITSRFWKLRANTTLDLLGGVQEHLHAVVHLLKHPLPSTSAQRLCALAGEIAQMLGQMLFDARELALAWPYYTLSVHAAQAAGNQELWAVGLGRMSLLLTFDGRPQQGLVLLDRAQHFDLQRARIRCWLAAVEAEAQAHLGNVYACLQAVERARQIEAHELLEEDRYAVGMNASRLAGYEGASFVRLQQPSRALPALQHALDLLDADALRPRSSILTDMGLAYAEQGEVGEACRVAGEALVITTHTRSLRVFSQVRALHSTLESWKASAPVQALEQQMAHTLAAMVA